MSGVLAGFGGMMAAVQAQSGVTIVGIGLELSAISAVVVGGTLLTGGAGTTGGTLAGRRWRTAPSWSWWWSARRS